MNASHTPTPWRVEKRVTKGQFVITHHIVSLKGDHIANVTPCDVDANAAFIARACNSHAELLSALEAMLAYIKSPIVPELCEQACAKAEAAIAKATLAS